MNQLKNTSKQPCPTVIWSCNQDDFCAKSQSIQCCNNNTNKHDHTLLCGISQQKKYNVKRIGTKQIIKPVFNIIQDPQLVAKQKVQLKKQKNKGEVYRQQNKENSTNKLSKADKKKFVLTTYEQNMQIGQQIIKDNNTNNYHNQEDDKQNEYKYSINKIFSNISHTSDKNNDKFSFQQKKAKNKQLNKPIQYISTQLIKIHPKISNKIHDDNKIQNKNNQQKKINNQRYTEGKNKQLIGNYKNKQKQYLMKSGNVYIEKIFDDVDQVNKIGYSCNRTQDKQYTYKLRNKQQQSNNKQNLSSSIQDNNIKELQKINNIKIFKTRPSFIQRQPLSLEKVRFQPKTVERSSNQFISEFNQNQQFRAILNQIDSDKIKLGQSPIKSSHHKFSNIHNSYHPSPTKQDKQIKNSYNQQLNNKIIQDQFKITSSILNKNIRQFQMNKCIVQARKKIIQGYLDF